MYVKRPLNNEKLITKISDRLNVSPYAAKDWEGRKKFALGLIKTVCAQRRVITKDVSAFKEIMHIGLGEVFYPETIVVNFGPAIHTAIYRWHMAWYWNSWLPFAVILMLVPQNTRIRIHDYAYPIIYQTAENSYVDGSVFHSWTRMNKSRKHLYVIRWQERLWKSGYTNIFAFVLVLKGF